MGWAWGPGKLDSVARKSIPAYTQEEISSYLATRDSMKCHRSDDRQHKKNPPLLTQNGEVPSLNFEASDKSKYRTERKITLADI